MSQDGSSVDPEPQTVARFLQEHLSELLEAQITQQAARELIRSVWEPLTIDPGLIIGPILIWLLKKLCKYLKFEDVITIIRVLISLNLASINQLSVRPRSSFPPTPGLVDRSRLLYSLFSKNKRHSSNKNPSTLKNQYKNMEKSKLQLLNNCLYCTYIDVSVYMYVRLQSHLVQQ